MNETSGYIGYFQPTLGWFLPAETPPVPNHWLHVHEIHVLLDRSALEVPPPRCGMFVATLWVGSKTPIENQVFFPFFFGALNLIQYNTVTCLLFAYNFLMVLCCTNLKTLWSLMVMCVWKSPQMVFDSSPKLWRNPRSVTVNRSINQSINQLRSEVKWNYLRIFLFQWKHLKISKMDTYQIHKLPLLPLAQYTWSLRPPPFGSDPTCCSNLAAFPILSHHGPPEKSV